ncbi:CPBP family intramembrane glutamic endopeptidase [Tahibacter caeni]|uniref:CPBP family intramembrane glutamic endopeptidase n=1 Tax=Tahibacter caeni TaxID=1453545 RepID=UPI002148CFBD|nr:CPBP family intramembrane glutamic endopeptidase [Tahibacter caeni]
MMQPNDRKLALLFVAIVLPLSWAYEAFLIVGGGVARYGVAGLVVLMWIPGLVSLLLRRFLRLGFADAGFAAARPKYLVQAVVLPLLLALATGVLCALLDVRYFAPLALGQWLPFAPVFALLLAVGLFGALGEELGWRGFLLPKLVAGGVAHPLLISGLVWAVWHLPLIAFGGFYATPHTMLVTAAYALSIVALGGVIGAVRLRSASLWPAVLLHAAHNFFFQLAVPALLLTQPGARADLWEILGADSGLLVALLYALAFVLWFRQQAGKA